MWITIFLAVLFKWPTADEFVIFSSMGAIPAILQRVRSSLNRNLTLNVCNTHLLLIMEQAKTLVDEG